MPYPYPRPHRRLFRSEPKTSSAKPERRLSGSPRPCPTRIRIAPGERPRAPDGTGREALPSGRRRAPRRPVRRVIAPPRRRVEPLLPRRVPVPPQPRPTTNTSHRRPLTSAAWASATRHVKSPPTRLRPGQGPGRARLCQCTWARDARPPRGAAPDPSRRAPNGRHEPTAHLARKRQSGASGRLRR